MEVDKNETRSKMKKYFLGFIISMFVVSNIVIAAPTRQVPWFEPTPEDVKALDKQAKRLQEQQQNLIEKNRREPIDAIERLTNEIKLLREAVERIEKKMPDSSVKSKPRRYVPLPDLEPERAEGY